MAKPKHFQRLAKRYPEYVSAVEKLGAAVKTRARSSRRSPS